MRHLKTKEETERTGGTEGRDAYKAQLSGLSACATIITVPCPQSISLRHIGLICTTNRSCPSNNTVSRKFCQLLRGFIANNYEREEAGKK
jgi:hypothetical protein